MTILERAVSTMQRLPIEQQQEALDFIEFLVFKLGDRQLNQVSEHLVDGIQVSPRDVLKKWEGAVEGGVDDLSFNKKYMEGYGQ